MVRLVPRGLILWAVLLATPVPSSAAAGNCSGVRHSANVVDLGEEARLPCSPCGRKSRGLKQSRLWYKLEEQRRKETESAPVWRSVEVEVDMHDDDKLNRVFVLSNHTLVIRDFQPDDVGTYFCEPPAPHDRHLAFALPDSASWEEPNTVVILDFLRRQEQVNVTAFFHLDIEIPMTKSLVSTDGLSYSLPSKPLIKEDENWMATTVWAEWGPCNGCGPTMGERRRIGRCMVTAVSDAPVAPGHVNQTLDMYPEGAPCHSSLFRGLQEVVRRPAEVQLGKCTAPCTGLSGEQGKVTWMDSRIQVAAFLTTRKPVEKITKTSYVGSKIQLYCPGAKSNDAIRWMNTSRLIHASRIGHETDGRVTVDVMNMLHVNNIQLYDAGIYSCWTNNRKTAEINLKVKELEKESEVHWYLALLTMIYAANFVVFVGIMVLNHQQRQVQLLKPATSSHKGQGSRSPSVTSQRSLSLSNKSLRSSRVGSQRSKSSRVDSQMSRSSGVDSRNSRFFGTRSQRSAVTSASSRSYSSESSVTGPESVPLLGGHRTAHP